jgi:hypothetical protein
MDEVISRLSPKYQEENDEMPDATGLSGCRFEFTERVPKKCFRSVHHLLPGQSTSPLWHKTL